MTEGGASAFVPSRGGRSRRLWGCSSVSAPPWKERKAEAWGSPAEGLGLARPCGDPSWRGSARAVTRCPVLRPARPGLSRRGRA